MTNTFTAADKLACAERELGFRRRVFPSRVSSGKMTQKQMDREIACMAAIAADYELQAATERLL